MTLSRGPGLSVVLRRLSPWDTDRVSGGRPSVMSCFEGYSAGANQLAGSAERHHGHAVGNVASRCSVDDPRCTVPLEVGSDRQRVAPRADSSAARGVNEP